MKKLLITVTRLEDGVQVVVVGRKQKPLLVIMEARGTLVDAARAKEKQIMQQTVGPVKVLRRASLILWTKENVLRSKEVGIILAQVVNLVLLAGANRKHVQKV